MEGACQPHALESVVAVHWKEREKWQTSLRSAFQHPQACSGITNVGTQSAAPQFPLVDGTGTLH